MNIGLFIPCFIDQFYPEVGKASYELLVKLGCEVDYPMNQTCCGQPMANGGHEKDARKLALKFVKDFSDYDYIVGPSGSCVNHVKNHYDTIKQTEAVTQVRENIIEISDFIVNVLKITKIESSFPKKVGVHQSCHGLRGLGLGIQTELNIPNQKSVVDILLAHVKGIQRVKLNHPDECCGFGGTFSITEPDVSVKMGLNRIEDHLQQEIEVITGIDMSCLMHLEGILKQKEIKVEVKHLVEILNSEL